MPAYQIDIQMNIYQWPVSIAPRENLGYSTLSMPLLFNRGTMLIAKMKVLLLGGALAAAFSAGWYVQGLRWDTDVAQRDKKQSEDISTGQQAIIAGQALQFHRYNEIAKQANEYAINIKAQSD
ncbi:MULTISPECIES: hypothetical protein [Symbiopectobacterium]|uniref:hypothetical protein n=1 Tax=Symbiopectobacterium TaxID=801 RepID=UPI0020799F9D|nr:MULTISPECIES: hypothetical protein [Symbiopectobacterium]MBT9429431.1 hypothetical protein [Candidatus Symbiopectobacterium endolongispinus]